MANDVVFSARSTLQYFSDGEEAEDFRKNEIERALRDVLKVAELQAFAEAELKVASIQRATGEALVKVRRNGKFSRFCVVFLLGFGSGLLFALQDSIGKLFSGEQLGDVFRGLNFLWWKDAAADHESNQPSSNQDSSNGGDNGNGRRLLSFNWWLDRPAEDQFNQQSSDQSSHTDDGRSRRLLTGSSSEDQATWSAAEYSYERARRTMRPRVLFRPEEESDS
uniref:Uncharacterized protein n=1 Tax=uncultured organism MedDCM-OCT-S09-C568 TaxID=743651 RepID=D6PJE6_9ZZZZ|nr:hypothetical protein [uncultured organism MedDCM-OCT-S09-C568]ADD95852.1 hypothetical protein [uncultured organism MedDCM-OCT-S09-C568]